MYQAFEAIISNGRIKPMEQVKLKESARVLVTVLEGKGHEEANWKALKKWISFQRRLKKYTRYSLISAAKKHIDSLLSE